MFVTLSTLLLMWAGYSISKSIGRTREAMAYQKVANELHRIRMKEERNKQVYLFRLRMIYMFESKVLDHCGTYEDMLESDKPLIAKEWVKIDELINLN